MTVLIYFLPYLYFYKRTVDLHDDNQSKGLVDAVENLTLSQLTLLNYLSSSSF